jgi:hypothetical protein
MYPGRYTNKNPVIPQVRISRLAFFGALIMVALVAFEIFNFSTTEFALRDILGGLRFEGIPWATILAIAFCGIDFAGLARMFTPEVGADEPREVWYLFGAWMLAALMNAMLTWWGVSIAISNHQELGNGIIARKTLLQVVPVFVAIMVWLIRVLIIGTFAATGDRLFGKQEKATRYPVKQQTQSWQTKTQVQNTHSMASRPMNYNRPATARQPDYIARPVMSQRPTQPVMTNIFQPAPRPSPVTPSEPEPPDEEAEAVHHPADPVYVPVGMASRNKGGNIPTKY